MHSFERQGSKSEIRVTRFHCHYLKTERQEKPFAFACFQTQRNFRQTPSNFEAWGLNTQTENALNGCRKFHCFLEINNEKRECGCQLSAERFFRSTIAEPIADSVKSKAKMLNSGITWPPNVKVRASTNVESLPK